MLRPATASDADAVTALVHAAYRPWVARIGGTPGPMELDYREVIAEHAVTVAQTEDRLVGLVVTAVTAEGFCIENVAVHPDHQGRGTGRQLLAHAEARARTAGAEWAYLYTHELMSENLALYRRLGYVEYRRARRGEAPLVFLRKPLR